MLMNNISYYNPYEKGSTNDTKLSQFQFVGVGGFSYGDEKITLKSEHENTHDLKCKLEEDHLKFKRSIDTEKGSKKKKNLVPNHLKNEKDRIKTFNGIKTEINLENLAKNGLFSVDHDKNSNSTIIKLQCAFCDYNCTIFNKSSLNQNYEIPEEEHLKKYPNCEINKDKVSIDTIKNSDNLFSTEQTDKEIEPIHFNSVNGIKNSEIFNEILNKTINATTERPYHSGYVTEKQRMESFTNWPSNLNQKPIDLAKAGFYYFGIKDMVKCFFCNVGICNWDPIEEPIIEHARWFPRCPFIKLYKGNEFIEKVREIYKDRDSGFEYDYDESLEYNSIVNNESLKNKRSVSPRRINSRMDLPVIQKIIKLGIFERSLIKHVIEKKLSEEDQDFKNPTELLKACYKQKESSNAIKEKLMDSFHFLISNVNLEITYKTVSEAFKTKFNVDIKLVKKLEENHGKQLHGTLFIRLDSRDESSCDKIINDLNDKEFPELGQNNKLIVKKMMKKKLKLEKSQNKENITDESNISKNSILKEEVESLNEARRCVICLENERVVIFLPCAHFSTCVSCSVAVKNCPLCRKTVEASIRAYT